MPEDDVVGRLFFGRDDAENDFTDGLLRTGFLPTRAFEEASVGRKTLIIGRKGSGKSAICMRLTLSPEHAGRTILVTPDDAAGDEIRRFELRGLTGETAKSLIWRYVFAVQAARYLVRHARDAHGNRFSSALRALRRFLRSSGEDEDRGFYDRVVRGGRGLQTSLSLEAFGVKAAVDHKGTSEGARASRQLEVLEAGVARAFSALGCARAHPPLLVLVDQLEQVWSTDPESEQLVIGLLLAGKHVARYYRHAMRCVLFLRADIYDTLDFGDADKFHSDEIRVDWTPAKLRELALLRARVSLGRNLTHDELWSRVFPARVDGEPTAQYLFSRTLPRPRDAIQFLNQCRDTARNHGHRMITAADVKDATGTFSQWKLLDLAKEYRVTLPFLDRIFVLFQNSGYVVMRKALAVGFEPFQETLRARFPYYAQGLDTDGVLEILYGVGFLGVRRGTEVAYAGAANVPIQPHENEFHIHPCFRPALNAHKATQLQAFTDANFGAQSRVIVAGTPLQQQMPGYDAIKITTRQDFALLNALIAACNRILRQLSRSDLPAESRRQISDEISRVLSGAIAVRAQLQAGADLDAVQSVVHAADYLGALAEQLVRAGLGEADVVRRIRDEVRILLDEIGGGRYRS